MTTTLRLLYLDDSAVDHRLLHAYLSLDTLNTYEVTVCETLEEAEAALDEASFDALLLDNRVPPYPSYHTPYEKLAGKGGFNGPIVVLSADIGGSEFEPHNRQGDEVVLDKADLLSAVRSGDFAQAVMPAR